MFSFIKTIFKNLSGFLLMLLLLAPASPAGAAKPADPLGTVTATVLQLRASPDSAAPSIKTLPKDTQVRILHSEKNWLKIEHEGVTGFVSRIYIKNKKAETEPPAATPMLNALKQKAGRIDSKLGQKQKEIETFTEQEKRIIETLDAIESSLNTAEKKNRAFEKEVATLTTELKKTESDFNALNNEVRELESYASSRLISLYKLSRTGTLPLMVSAESLYELLGKKKSLQRLLAHDESVWKTLSLKRTAVDAAQKDLHLKRQTHQAKVDELEDEIRNLSRRRAERTALLAGIQGKKALALAAIASLKEASDALDRQILEAARQPPEPPPPPPPPEPRPAPPPEPRPTGEPRPAIEPQKTTEPSGTSEPPKTSEPPARNRVTDEFKGLLNMPVNGNIISFFGPYTLPHVNVPGFKSGIDIQAPIGEPIRAVKGGTTLFAGWFKGYGNMVILDHGDNYCTVYTHAQELFKTKGDAVKPGEIIGTVGDTGSLDGPKLHFEIRHHGKPVDPLKWIEKRSQN